MLSSIICQTVFQADKMDNANTENVTEGATVGYTNDKTRRAGKEKPQQGNDSANGYRPCVF